MLYIQRIFYRFSEAIYCVRKCLWRNVFISYIKFCNYSTFLFGLLTFSMHTFILFTVLETFATLGIWQLSGCTHFSSLLFGTFATLGIWRLWPKPSMMSSLEIIIPHFLGAGRLFLCFCGDECKRRPPDAIWGPRLFLGDHFDHTAFCYTNCK